MPPRENRQARSKIKAYSALQLVQLIRTNADTSTLAQGTFYRDDDHAWQNWKTSGKPRLTTRTEPIPDQARNPFICRGINACAVATLAFSAEASIEGRSCDFIFFNDQRLFASPFPTVPFALLTSHSCPFCYNRTKVPNNQPRS